ncbi:MAG: sodium:solute symporter family protein, partial [Bacteroidota bacterium]
MVTLAAGDKLLILAYFIAVLVIGFLSSRKSGSSTADFLLAGRSLTLPLFVMTLVSTWYGGILGVGEFSYRYGISNWVVQGAPYYIFAGVFAFLLAKKIRATNLLTIPDKLHQSYDKKTAILGAFLTFILMTPAPYILMLAMLLQLVTGWGLVLCVVLGTVATTAYLLFGGFRSDVYTDVLEFILMFVGFAVILPFAYAKFGGLDFIRQNVPPLHLTWNGGNSVQFVLVWFFIALWTLVDPSFHQRCYAAKSGAVAQKGILVSIIFWFVFDAMTAIVGLYARAALPNLAQPVMAYPMLAEITLPSVAKGLFYIGMLATIMSTLNTLAFVSGATLGRDIVWRYKDQPDESRVTRYTRWGIMYAAVLAIVLALAIPSVIKLWYTI